MSTETPIRHILLIPNEGDPHGLLRDGPCFTAPPLAVWSNVDHRWDEAPPHTRAIYTDGKPKRTLALVLAWDGEPVPEGCDRADRARDGGTIEGLYLLKSYTLENAIAIGAACEAVGLGRLVVVRA